jgi:hypothetical protein
MPDSAVAHTSPSAHQMAGSVAFEQVNGVLSAPLPIENEQAAPADLVVPPKWWERLAWYFGSALLSCLLIYAGLRLDQADLKAPFYYDLDSLLILPMVKSTVERGFGGHWRTERLGAPGILELHDFPVIDHLHFFLIWLLGKVVPDLGLLYNLYFLLTFPLTTLTAMIAFRQLRLTLPAAAVGGLLYSFLPYHYQRWENHYFLAAYWMVPLSLLPAFAICKGEFPFFRRLAEGCYQKKFVSWGSLGYVVLALAIASSGAYYAFFTCAFIAFAAVYSLVVARKWQAAASASAIIGLIVVFGVANHLPAMYYQSIYGVNPVTDRSPGDADRFGLKITHLVLPIEDHNLRLFARYKWYYNSPDRPVENENRSAALGIVGVAGLMGLVISLLLPYRPGWPYGPLAGMTVFGVLLATIGGFGSVFNLLVTAQIRSYNRISVFIAFLCFLATLWAIDRFLVKRRRTLPVLYLTYALLPFVWMVLFPCRVVSGQVKERIDRWRNRLRARIVSVKWLVWGAVLVIGFLDQTPYSWFKSTIVKALDEQANRFQADSRFFAEIERTMPAGSTIFCLPYVQYPESPTVHKMSNYEPARGYLHTETLIWSYGAMKGREADAWQMDVSFRDTEELLQRIVYRGFDGLLIDKRGYPTQKDTNEAFEKITRINKIYSNLVEQRNPKTRNAQLPEIRHEDGQQFFIDLRPYREEIRQANPLNYDAKVKEEREWAAVLWLGGFFVPERPGEVSYTRFGPPEADMWVINPSDRTRKFQVSMSFHAHGLGIFQMQLSGLVEDDFHIDRKSSDKDLRKESVEKRYQIEVPPGRHAIHFKCTPSPQFIPDDSRRLCYYMTDYKFEEQR